MVSAVS